MELPHHLRLIPWPTTTSESKKGLTEEEGKEHMAWEQGCCLQQKGSKSEWLNEFHFLPAAVLRLNFRESMWVVFPCVESPGGHLCVCKQSVPSGSALLAGRSGRLSRMGRLMGPVWVHGGMAQAPVNVPFQRRFSVAHCILAVKAPP